MHHLKKNNVDIHLVPTKLPAVKSAVIVMGIPFASGCYATLKGLQNTCKCCESPYSSAFMFSVFVYIRAKMLSTHADELSSHVSDIDCNYQNGEFTVSATCTGSMSGIRKTLTNLLKHLAPAKIYPAYKGAIKQLSEECSEKLTVDRKIFTYLADEMVKSIKKCLTVVIGGRCLLKPDQFEKLVTACAGKLNVLVPKGDKLNPKETNVCIGKCLVKCSGFDAILTKRYLETALGTRLHLINNCLYGSNQYESAIVKLADADKIKRYVGTRYKKFKTDLSAALVYLAMVNNLTDTKTLLKFAKSSATGASILTGIKSCLK